MKRRHLARRNVGIGNPSSSDVATALHWLGGGAVVGAALGAITTAPITTGALNGAAGGVAIVGVGGLVVAIFDKSARPAGFATAGIGLGGLALLGLVGALVSPAVTKAA